MIKTNRRQNLFTVFVAFTFLLLGSFVTAQTDKLSTEDRKFVNRWVSTYNAPSRAAWQKPDKVIEYLDIKPGMQIADIGAGTGYFLPKLSKAAGKAGKVFAVDIDRRYLLYLEETVAKYPIQNVVVHKGEANNPLLKSNSIDRILMVNTWHHIEQKQKYLDHMKSSLKENGKIVIIDYDKPQPWDKQKKHYSKPNSLQQYADTANLKMKIIAEDLNLQYVVQLLKN